MDLKPNAGQESDEQFTDLFQKKKPKVTDHKTGQDTQRSAASDGQKHRDNLVQEAGQMRLQVDAGQVWTHKGGSKVT